MDNPPLGYFLTWTTYGTWLPGDDRWWTQRKRGHQPPNFRLRKQAQSLMTEPSLTLSTQQRELVNRTITEHCTVRGWKLWIVNCRTNHVHVVVTANAPPGRMVIQFKAWCTRRLKEQLTNGCVREEWWTEGACKPPLFTPEDLEDALIYVRDCQ